MAVEINATINYVEINTTKHMKTITAFAAELFVLLCNSTSNMV